MRGRTLSTSLCFLGVAGFVVFHNVVGNSFDQSDEEADPRQDDHDRKQLGKGTLWSQVAVVSRSLCLFRAHSADLGTTDTRYPVRRIEVMLSPAAGGGSVAASSVSGTTSLGKINSYQNENYSYQIEYYIDKIILFFIFILYNLLKAKKCKRKS